VIAGVLAAVFLATFFCFLVVLAVDVTAGFAGATAGAAVFGAGAGVVCAKLKVRDARVKAMVEIVVFILFSPAGLAARSQSHSALSRPEHR
jgi:hypothetical protein